VGNPARKIKDVSDEMMEWKTAGTALYQALPAEMHADWQACEPLNLLDEDRPSQDVLYQTWKSISTRK
jgi:phenylacetic acid degradation protein